MPARFACIIECRRVYIKSLLEFRVYPPIGHTFCNFELKRDVLIPQHTYLRRENARKVRYGRWRLRRDVDEFVAKSLRFLIYCNSIYCKRIMLFDFDFGLMEILN